MKKKTKLDLLKELDNYKTFGIQLKEGMEEKGYSRQRLSEEKFGSLGGFAQQYLFYYIRIQEES